MQPPNLGMPNPTAFRPAMGGQNIPFPNARMNPDAMAMGRMFMPPIAGPLNMDQDRSKLLIKRHYSCGLYVSGFEKTLTLAMINEHFKIKPIDAIKFPKTKFNENKGFAFIYYKTEDDAKYVKKELDHSVILKDKIRICRMVDPGEISKMIIKLKREQLSPQQIQKNKETFFNDEQLEKEVENIINPIFKNVVEVNKIHIPTNKDKKTLTYARVFFHICDLNEAFGIYREKSDSQDTKPSKPEQYEKVMSFIEKILNENQRFSKFASAAVYNYTNTITSTVLHFKGVKYNKDENPTKLSQEFQQFIEDQQKQATIIGTFAKIVEAGAWVNVTFSKKQEALAAYEHFKNNRIKFRDTYVYANLINHRDDRTVVVSSVRSGIDNKTMHDFLTKISENSKRVDSNDELKGRKFDFFSFIITDAKDFYLNNEGEIVRMKEALGDDQKSWRSVGSIPRRVIINFVNEIDEKSLRELLIEIKALPGWDKIFIQKNENDPKYRLRAIHQKGHIKNSRYHKHIALENRTKKVRQQQQQQRPARMRNQQGDQAGRKPENFHQFKFQRGQGAPNIGNPNFNRPQGQAPPVGAFGKMNSMPMQARFQPIPRGNQSMGQPGIKPPMGGQNPTMGGMKPPGTNQGQMNQPIMGKAPIMGSQPPMMGQPPPPKMGQPTMGQPSMGQPLMGKPPMGQPPMGQQPPKPPQQ